MTEYKSDLLRTLSERGFIHQLSDAEGLDALALAGPVTGYIGFDCTATSFHVGNLVSIMMLRWMQKTGNRPIALMGGGTTRVGDPSGKDDVRKLLTYEEIEQNKQSLKDTFANFIAFGDPPSGAIMIDNAEWLAPLNYIDFLRDVGRHF
jgi:tyrosyl-tRNA synthetase